MENEIIKVSLIVGILGIFPGVILILSISSHNKFIKSGGILAYLISNVLSLGQVFTFLNYQKDKTLPVLCFLLSTVITFIVIYFVIKQSKKDLTLYTFLFDIDNEIQEYLNEQKKLIANKLNINILNEKNERLIEKDKKLENQTKEIQNQLKILNEEKNKIEKLLNGVELKFAIPINGNIPLDSSFIEKMPLWLKNIWQFYEVMDKECVSYVKNIKKQNHTHYNDCVVGFFSLLSMRFCTSFFNENEVRMHFRILKDDQYISFAAMKGSHNDQPKVFNKNEGVFSHLGKERRSIVKSKNEDIFAPGSNPIWEDFLSGCFDEYIENGFPKLTFGISIRYSLNHSQFLYFLSFIRFEDLLYSIICNFEYQFKEHINKKFSLLEVLVNGNNKQV